MKGPLEKASGYQGDVDEDVPAVTEADEARVTVLETSRLILQPCSPEQLLVLIEHPERFEELAGYPAAEGLRGFFVSDDVSPVWLAKLRSATGPDPWRHGFFLIERHERSVIGSAGFKGHPDSSGVVEIAYGVVPRSEGKGYATEAARALVEFAFARRGVALVCAHTLPTANASTRVLTKSGFRHTGSVIDPEDGPVWRWERTASSGSPLPSGS